MNSQVIDRPIFPVFAFGTSSDCALQPARLVLLCIGGALAVQATTSTESDTLKIIERSAAEQTNSGLLVPDATTSQSAAVAELRRRSGLTWDQLARLFGVARRSVHFWASGKALNASNEERLGRLLAVIGHIDRGNAQETRAALMTAQSDGVIPFDLLSADKFDEVMERLGAGSHRTMPAQTPLSSAALAARMPTPPGERVDLLHDTVHRDVGNFRPARKGKVRRDR